MCNDPDCFWIAICCTHSHTAPHVALSLSCNVLYSNTLDTDFCESVFIECIANCITPIGAGAIKKKSGESFYLTVNSFTTCQCDVFTMDFPFHLAGVGHFVQQVIHNKLSQVGRTFTNVRALQCGAIASFKWANQGARISHSADM